MPRKILLFVVFMTIALCQPVHAADPLSRAVGAENLDKKDNTEALAKKTCQSGGGTYQFTAATQLRYQYWLWRRGRPLDDQYSTGYQIVNTYKISGDKKWKNLQNESKKKLIN